MPFDPILKVVNGTDALAPLPWARKVFCEWLAAQLNDANGPYAGELGVTPPRPAFVLENGEIARAMYRRSNSPPVVSLMQGPVDSELYLKNVDGVSREGERLSIEWTLDMGIKDATPDDDDLSLERRDDSNLASFVRDAVKRGFFDLNGLGLFNLDIEPDAEKQRAGEGRHPHRVTLFVRTLPS